MQQEPSYERARARATVKYGFFVHAAVYVAVMLMLLIVDMLTSPGTIWFYWPLLGWGLALGLHAARAFLPSSRDTLVDRLTERELQRSRTEKSGGD